MTAKQKSFDKSKWKDAFLYLLKNIQKKLFPHLSIEQDDALAFIEELIIKLMSLVMDKNPRSVQDLERIILNILPAPINEYAKKKAESVLHECLETHHHDSNFGIIPSSKKLANLVSIASSTSHQHPKVNLANCKLVMCPIVEKVNQSCELDMQTSVYLCALLEYVADDIFKLVCKYVENISNDRIKLQDVRIALNADNLLMDLFYGNNEYSSEDCDVSSISLIGELSRLDMNRDETHNCDDATVAINVYVNIVKKLINEERSFLKELNLIIKVFREPFLRLLNACNSVPSTPTVTGHNFDSLITNADFNQSIDSKSVNDASIIEEEDIDKIFSNVTDIYEFSNDFLSLIEDTIEMNEESEGIGYCFQEMAEGVEFDVFRTFVEELFENCKKEDKKPHSHLRELFKNQKLVACLNSTYNKNLLLCIHYILPKLLNGVVVHCLHYFEYIKFLINTSPNNDDRESLRQSEGLLDPLKLYLEENFKFNRDFKLNEGYLRLTRSHPERQFENVKNKLEELSKKIDGFNSLKEKYQMCNEFICEGVLCKARKGDKKGSKYTNEKQSERYCFLFDALLICCKILPKNISGSGCSDSIEYKMKECHMVRNFDVCDSQTDPKSFELVGNRDQKEVLLFLAKSVEEKDVWISNLLMLSQRPILERNLDSILSEEERRIPLKLPDPKHYRFAEEDSDSNIIFDSSSGKDVIKAATIIKLIERLTHHQFPDTKFSKTFLTTYRGFCEPEQLLDLLIERFNIPFEEEHVTIENNRLPREETKRFKKEYLEPIQLRVLNVFKQWVESHYYDLNESMIKRLNDFLIDLQNGKYGKNLKKWADVLIARIDKKKNAAQEKVQKYLSEKRPPILYSHEEDFKEFNLLTVHPVEFARQLTLYEFELYCAVDTFELMGAKWTKPDKNILSPNMMKLSKHSSNFVYWIEKEIVECSNIEERQAMISRSVQIMQILFELNNFNGLFEIFSALQSACIHRLDTYEKLQNIPKYRTIIDKSKDLLDKNHSLYYQKLRSINPPCVPFLGCYLTQLVYIEEGNKDYIDGDAKQMINFSKLSKIAEITSEIQQYQNQPYCLNVYEGLYNFIKNLDPLEGREVDEFEKYVYQKSLEIEPKDNRCKPKAERKYKAINLKSPGIHPSSAQSLKRSIVFHHNHQTSSSSITNNDSNNNPTIASSSSTYRGTPNHTPSSSTPTSPNQINHSSIPSQILPGSPDTLISMQNSLASRDTIRNLVTGDHVMANKHSSSNHTDSRPPPIKPRSRSSFSNNIHQRTNSESSNTSIASPNFISQSNSAFNTPFLTGCNRENIFQFPCTLPLMPTPSQSAPCLPPKNSRLTPSQSPSPYFASNSTSIDNSLVDISTSSSRSHSNIPPPLPPKKFVQNRMTPN